jgi:guanosine-diphosphatase
MKRRAQTSAIASLVQRLLQRPRILMLASALLFWILWPADVAHFTGGVVRASVQQQQQQSAAANCGDFADAYSIMMDAGSTGSRTHIFIFKKNAAGGSLSLEHEVFEQLKPGLSAFDSDADGAAKSLIPLMESAMNSIPKDRQKCTPIALKATAGLRLLGEEKSHSILKAVQALFAKYPFAAGQNAVEVMDGKDEGPYAWLTVNFLLGNLEANKKTAAILDLGGGSTQIVFQPDSSELLHDAPEENLYKATIRGVNVHAYQHSYLGLGLKEAGKSILKVGAATPDADFPCLPPGHEEKVDEVVVKNTKPADFAACAAIVSRHVIRRDDSCTHQPCAFNGVFQPNLASTFSGDIYAFSYFYDRMEAFLPENGAVTVGTFKETGTKICAGVEEPYKAKNLGSMCMDFSFLYMLLSHGYGLSDDRKLFITKKINGAETAWSLGASLVAMS